MKRFVQIDNGVVTGLLDAGIAPSQLPLGRIFVEVESFPDPLSVYDAAAGSFTPPPPPPDYGRAVSVRDFLQLFTAAERKAIRAAAKLDDDVADWYALATAGGSGAIRLQHPTTLGGLQFLVSKALLTAARRDAITAS